MAILEKKTSHCSVVITLIYQAMVMIIHGYFLINNKFPQYLSLFQNIYTYFDYLWYS